MESLPYADAREHLVRDALRRNVALILALGVVFGLAAWFVTSKATTTYTSQTKVLIHPTVGNALSPDSATSSQRVTVAMTTEAALVDSPTIATGVGKKVGMSTSDTVAAVSASVPANTQLILVTFQDKSSATTQKGAQEFATQYLAYRKAQSQAVVKAQVDNLSKQEKAVQASLTSAGKAAAVTDAKPDANAQVQLYASRLATIQNNIATAQATDANPGTVVMPATTPAPQSNIIYTLLVPAGVVLGLLLGFALALWRERRDDRVRGSSEHVIAGAPVLAVVPRKASGAREVTTVIDGVVSESYRQVRAGILASRGTKGKVFAVVGVSDGIRVGDVAVNIGVALSRAGHSVVVADATGGWEDLSHTAGVTSEIGFGDLLRDSAAGEPWTNGAAGVDIVTAGPDPAGTEDLFHSDAMAAAVTAVSGSHSFTLLAGAAVTTAEGSGVVLTADSVILVVEDRRSTHAQVQTAAQRCVELGTVVLGIVSVPPTPKEGEATRPVASESRTEGASTVRSDTPGASVGAASSPDVSDDALVTGAGRRTTN